MKATHLLHNLGQSIWLDNMARDLLNTGKLPQYIDDLSGTCLTSTLQPSSSPERLHADDV